MHWLKYEETCWKKIYFAFRFYLELLHKKGKRFQINEESIKTVNSAFSQEFHFPFRVLGLQKENILQQTGAGMQLDCSA